MSELKPRLPIHCLESKRAAEWAASRHELTPARRASPAEAKAGASSRTPRTDRGGERARATCAIIAASRVYTRVEGRRVRQACAPGTACRAPTENHATRNIAHVGHTRRATRGAASSAPTGKPSACAKLSTWGARANAAAGVALLRPYEERQRTQHRACCEY
jgi:hypothetical protein